MPLHHPPLRGNPALMLGARCLETVVEVGQASLPGHQPVQSLPHQQRRATCSASQGHYEPHVQQNKLKSWPQQAGGAECVSGRPYSVNIAV